MKEFKFVMMVFVAVFIMMGSVFAVGEGGTTVLPDPNVNPLNVARAFALKTPDHYRCYLGADMLISNSFQRVEMEFTMAKNFAITSLIINGDKIALPEPILGLPLGDGGLMRNVYLNVNAMSKSGEYAGNGYIQKSAVSKGESLTVLLVPADIRQEIPVDVAKYGNDIELIVEDFTYGYGYGVSDGKFYAYLPPVGGRYHYSLRRWSDKTVIGDGWLEPFKPVVTPSDAYVGITYLGNVQEVEFTMAAGWDEWAGLNNISFDCLVPTDDGSVAGKVIFADFGSGGLDFVASGEYWVYVQSATSEEGDMPFLELEDHSSFGNGWSETRVNTTDLNVGKVVITIIPKPTNTRENPWINLHRYYSLGGKR